MSAASAATRRSRTGSICGSSPTICAKARRSMPSRSLKSWSRSISAASASARAPTSSQCAALSGESRIAAVRAIVIIETAGSISASSSMSHTTDFETIRRQLASTIHAHWKLFLAQGIVMMVLGFLAVAVPNLATLAVEIFVGWLFFVGGIFRAVSVWHSRRAPGFVWSLLTALLSIVLGLILIVRPLEGVLTLTMVLVAFFIIEGIASIIGAIEHRQHLRSWGWVLFSGVIDLLLAYLIWAGWPSSASWAIGLLVGINMIFLGLSLVMTALAARLIGNQ